MKALAARTRDVRRPSQPAVLAEVDSVEKALQICRDSYPDEVVSRRTLAVLEELFG
jgi:hypothetical protein